MTKICIIAGNHREAEQWARGQDLDNNCWFYPSDFEDLRNRENFHVIVIGTAGQNVPNNYFENLYNLAKLRGRINRR